MLKLSDKYPGILRNHFLLLFLVLGVNFSGIGQQVIGSFPNTDGGFENQSGTLGTAASISSSQTYWTTQAASTGVISSTGGRSGPKYVVYNQTGSTHKRLQSPTSDIIAGSYIVQFYYQGDLDGGTYGDIRGAASSNGTANPSYGAYVLGSNTGATWTKYTATVAPSHYLANIGIGILSANNTAQFYIDDFVIYPGSSVDVTTPDSPGSVTVNNATQTSLTINWAAASGGTDGGGYVVVRYSSNPNADNDPNQNGIYALGNTINNGTGSLIGTVRYIGTGTSFTDNTGLTSGTTFWYKVYTVDKAFNYSDESNGNGSTLPETTPYISVGSLTGFGNQVVNTTSAEKSYTVAGGDLSNNIVITPPANFEISLTSGSGFIANPASISLAPSGGIVSPTSIYVRFKPTALTGYSGNITHTSTGAASQDVAVSGTGTAPEDPTGVSATAISNSEIDIAFTRNGTNNVMIAWNTSATFGTPSGGYTAGNSISGGGSVLYVGGSSPYLHLSLASNTAYYYKIWTVDPLNFYSPGVEVNASTLPAKPSNHPTGFTASAPSPSSNNIDFSWKDAGGTTIPDGYLIKASATSYESIVAPVDGTPETDGTLSKIVGPVVQMANFTGLNEGTTYYFKVWPYTNSGTSINYKTDGTPPQVAVTTKSSHIFFSEYLEGLSNNKALEIYNGETWDIDLTKLTVNTYANGAALASYTWTGTGGTLAAGSTYVISNSLANATIQALSNTNSQVCWFNGNDAIELVYDGQVVDKIGLIGGVPPATGSGWSVAGIANATMDKTLVRKLNITSGTSDWSLSAGTDTGNSQWVVLGTDYTGNLGFYGTAWTGTAGTSWTDGTNWDLGVPSATVNCLISPAANNPEITTAVVVNNLLIKAYGTLTVTGTMTVNGVLTILQ